GRCVYTLWRLSAPYPSFLTFDTPDRSACTVKRPRSNSPLHALKLQNDPVYVELARSLAHRALAETTGQFLHNTLIRPFGTVTSRPPTEAELTELRAIHA